MERPQFERTIPLYKTKRIEAEDFSPASRVNLFQLNSPYGAGFCTRKYFAGVPATASEYEPLLVISVHALGLPAWLKSVIDCSIPPPGQVMLIAPPA